MSNIYQPESLHPYIMNDRLKKATGSGGIGNIPIASSDTVGGIKVPANSGMTVDADGAISGVPYSTTVHKTGRKTVGGKNIYEKTINITSLLGNGSDNTIDFTCTGLIKYYGSASKTGTIIPIPYTASDVSNGLDIYIDTTNNKLHLMCRGNFTSYTDAEITIEYTID